ncbi:MAG: GWxTD domain-containing protein [Balneolaceae bacterium]
MEYRSANKFFLFLRRFFIVLLAAGCSNAYVDDIKRGAGYEYRPGFPEVRVEVAGIIDENDQPKIQVTGNLVHNSLVFREVDGQLISEVGIEINLTNHTANTSDHISYSATVTKDSALNSFDEEIYIFERELEASPGDYTVDVSVTDQSSQKTTTRSVDAYLPNPGEETSNITNIRILASRDKNGSELYPVTTYDVGLGADTVKFIFQVTNNNPDEPINIQSRLIKFNSDTTIARAMSHNNYSPSHISYKGIEYDRYEVVQSSNRILDQPGSVLIEFAYTDLGRGNYRFEVAKDLENRGELYKARDFSLKSENYPALKNPRELAEPLYYLMSEKEHENLMSIKSYDSLKREIDRFWLQNIKDSRVARNVISMYYQRVEEANKQFSNFKEGWKTDAGKIYILFGPPWYVETRLSTMQWSYAYDRSDPEYNFYFQLPKIKSSSYPFENYILQRDNFYFNIEYQQIQLWKSGYILRRNL